MPSAARFIAVALLVWPALAQADGDRERGFLFDLIGGMGGFVGSSTGPTLEVGLGLSYAVDVHGTVALGAELDYGATLSGGRHHDRTAATVTLEIWTTDRISLGFGAGTPVGPGTDETAGQAFAGFARVGYDVVRWPHKALVVRFGVDGESTTGNAGLAAVVSVGLQGFALGHSIDLSQHI